MGSAKDRNARNKNNAVHRRKVSVMSAPVCFLCQESYGSMELLYHHMISGDHSDNELKTYPAQLNTKTINVRGQRKNLDAKGVGILKKNVFGWNVVTGKRGRPGLKVVKDDVKIDDELKEAVEGLLLLARGHPAPSKEIHEPVQMKIRDLMVGVVSDHPSMTEPTVVPETLIQAADADFKGGYMQVVVHNFDLNEEPLSTAMEDED